MQVKRFFAADMRQAMKLVRDDWAPTPPLSETVVLPAVSS